MKVVVVLDLGSKSDAQIMVDADHYIMCMMNNPRFTANEVVTQITVTQTAVSDMRAAMNNTLIDARKVAREILERNVTILGHKVEDIANEITTPDSERIDYVHSAGMDVKNKKNPGRHKFAVSNSNVSGTVKLIAQGGARSHEWRYTEDIVNFTEKIELDITTKGQTEITNLKRKTEYAFFHRAIEVGKKNDWEGPIFLIIT